MHVHSCVFQKNSVFLLLLTLNICILKTFQAALIMQVLQLTDQQIAMLPPDQRQSILILKEQIQRSGGVP